MQIKHSFVVPIKPIQDVTPSKRRTYPSWGSACVALTGDHSFHSFLIKLVFPKIEKIQNHSFLVIKTDSLITQRTRALRR